METGDFFWNKRSFVGENKIRGGEEEVKKLKLQGKSVLQKFKNIEKHRSVTTDVLSNALDWSRILFNGRSQRKHMIAKAYLQGFSRLLFHLLALQLDSFVTLP